VAERDLLQLARDMYGAYATGDRGVVERMLAADFEFFSPADPGIGRERYFERCWPASAHIEDFRFARLARVGEEVLVTYEATRSDGTRFRNTEVLTFADGRLQRAEVYFGWDL
jgi:ketosteroid isomerase-like protein